MIPITIERIINAIAITSLLSLFAPAAGAQPLVATLETASEEITLEHKQSDVRNGVYLFSSSSQPTHQDNFANNAAAENVEYMVLQLENNQVIGGFYQPLSEYSCFTGTVHGESLDLWVSPPDTTKAYPYSILTRSQTAIASHPNAVDLTTHELVLRDAQRISTLDPVSQTVLDACMVEFNRG